jgi:hypothetical protein
LFSYAGDRRAIAFQLLAALDEYDQDLRPLVRGYDPERYASLARQFDQLRLYAGSLPELSVAWVAVLVSRAEMTFNLFRAQHDPQAREGVAGFIERHRTEVEELRGSCARLIR